MSDFMSYVLEMISDHLITTIQKLEIPNICLHINSKVIKDRNRIKKPIILTWVTSINLHRISRDWIKLVTPLLTLQVISVPGDLVPVHSRRKPCHEWKVYHRKGKLPQKWLGGMSQVHDSTKKLTPLFKHRRICMMINEWRITLVVVSKYSTNGLKSRILDWYLILFN